MSREILKPLFWSMVVAAIWCLSMVHAEHNGYRRGYDDGHNIGIEAGLAKCAARSAVTQSGSVNVNGSSGDVSIK